MTEWGAILGTGFVPNLFLLALEASRPVCELPSSVTLFE